MMMAHDHELLILAVTRMRTGVCVAGMARTTDSVSRLRWVRPVKHHGALLAGDIRYASGRLMRAGDVISWRHNMLQSPPPHIEDALVDPIRDRPVLLRHLDPAQRAGFCARQLDHAPDDVLLHETRSLCIVRPEDIHVSWNCDAFSGHYEARLAFRHGRYATDARGLPVTDLAWRALGRAWLDGRDRLELSDPALRERIGEVYLVIGISRTFDGRRWPLIVGVHAAGLPEIELDEAAL
jgi:hypothetical protein